MTSNFLKDKIDEMHKRIGKCKKETSDGVILGDPSAKTAVKFKMLGDFINTKSDIKSTQKEENLGKLHAEAKVPHPLMLDEVSASFISWLRVSSWEDLGKEFGGYKIGRILAYILDILNQQIEDSTAATIRADVPLCEQCPTVKMRYNKNFDFGEWKDSICKCGGKCKHNESKSEADEVKNEMTLIKMENEVLHCRACLREIRKTIYKVGLSPCPRNIQDEVRDILQNILKKVKEGLKEEEI